MFVFYEGKPVTLVAIPEDEVPEQKGELVTWHHPSGTCVVALNEPEYPGDDGIREVPFEQLKGYSTDC